MAPAGSLPRRRGRKARRSLAALDRAARAPTESLTKLTYAYATAADAAEAEGKYAHAREKRERERREREDRLYAFAVTADRREESMHRLTKASVIVALVSLATSVAALVVAVLALD